MDLLAESTASAKDAGLRYVSNDDPGISRKRRGQGFVYFDPSGKPVRDKETLGRIRALVIPPAWTDVWICTSPNGHLQAVGRDARRRKQYRYHTDFRRVRDEAKYERMIPFAKSLPKIHRATSRDLRRRKMPQKKVLAAIIRVMEKTLIRVGNEEYAQQNHSYGLTTLHDRHAKIRGGKVHFEFRGKSGQKHEIDLNDARLADIVKKCQDLPGEQLFQYVDDAGEVRGVDSADVNDYLRSIAGEEFTAKDFRTWAGTILAARALCTLEKLHSKSARKKNIVRAVEVVAQKLGNTKAVCRKCYIHPAVIDAYLDGSLDKLGTDLSSARLKSAVLALLRAKIKGKNERSGRRVIGPDAARRVIAKSARPMTEKRAA